MQVKGDTIRCRGYGEKVRIVGHGEELVPMGRLVAACVLALTTLGWPAATGVASTATLQAVERLEGDFDGDGFIDLAISVPFEDVATARDAGAVSVLYGSAGGLTTGGQAFWQGTGGRPAPPRPATSSAPRWPAATSTATASPTWRSGFPSRMSGARWTAAR
jgi:FG-GAP repeat